MSKRARSRKVNVEALARLEGEAGLTVRVRDDQVTDVMLRVFEPPRLFEGFLRGNEDD